MSKWKITICGKEYPSKSAAARDIGINISTLKRRLKMYELNDPRLIKGNEHIKPVILQGKRYPTYQIAADLHGIKENTLIQRVKLWGPNHPLLFKKPASKQKAR